MAERTKAIREVLRGRILFALQSGAVGRGDRLPSARQLGTEFGVDHRKVLAAYRELAEDNLIEIRPRGGVYVAAQSIAADGPAVPAEGWVIEFLAEGVSREVPLPELHEWLRRSVETLRLRAVAIEKTSDQTEGMCRELQDDYGLEASGLNVVDLRPEDAPPSEIRQADLLVTTRAHATVVRQIADRAGKPCIVASVRPDLIEGEWRMLLRAPVYVVAESPRFLATLRRFFATTPGAENIRPLVVGRDDLAIIPDGAPTYITRRARKLLGSQRVAGRILPAARLFSTECAREIIAFIVRANLGAVAARAEQRREAGGGKREA